jgi:hypothetical protein
MKINFIAVIVAFIGYASPSFAHKSKDTHSHCIVDGKGVKVSGKTDAARKKACGKIAGSAWDEQNPKPIETSAAPAPAETKSPDASQPAPAAGETK